MMLPNDDGSGIRRLIDKDTVLCISVSAHPGDLGTTLHNEAYRALGLNFIYKACRTENIVGAIAGVRALGIRGCSVSMPYKERVLSELDDIDDAAKAIGAVNSIVNRGGHLTGYNTDWIGARAALQLISATPGERVLVMGAGGVARAILYALRHLGFSSADVACRNVQRLEQLQGILPCRSVAWAKRDCERADVLVNATPLGTPLHAGQSPASESMIRAGRAVFDVVVSFADTPLVLQARAAGKCVAAGYDMSLAQVAAQFGLYTDTEPPTDVLRRSLERWLVN